MRLSNDAITCDTRFFANGDRMGVTLVEPAAQKPRAVDAEHRSVVRTELLECNVCSRDNMRFDRDCAHGYAFVTHIAIGEIEARLAIVALLRNYAVEADRATGEMCESGVPQRNPATLSSIRRLDDVQTEESERRVVLDDGDRGDRFVVQDADEKSIRV